MPHWTATIYCDCRWKTVFKTVVISAEAPSRRRSWRPPRPSRPAAACRSPRCRSLLQNAAESNLSSTRRRRRHHLLRLPAASELPGRRCPGRPRPRPSPPGERRRPPFRRWLLPGAARPRGLPRARRVGRGSAGRGAGGPAPPPGRRRAPPAWCCRLGARRNAAEMKFLSSFDLYVLSSLSPSLLLMEIILNKLETELIELLSSWCSCYGTWSATSNYFYNLLDLLPEVASSSIFSQ